MGFEEAQFLLKDKKKKLLKFTKIYKKNIENNSFEIGKGALKNIEILEKDIITIKKIIKIYKLYSGKKPIYPLKGEELLTMIKLIKELNIPYYTTKQYLSPIEVNTDIWGYNNTLIIMDLTKEKSLQSSYEILTDQESVNSFCSM